MEAIASKSSLALKYSIVNTTQKIEDIRLYTLDKSGDALAIIKLYTMIIMK